MRLHLSWFARRGPWLAAAFLCAFAHAQQPGVSEYEVKAAFLYNFAKFVDWADEGRAVPEDGFVLCIAGSDPFGPELAAIEGRLVRGRPLRLKRGVALDALNGCHMLFVPESEARRLSLILKAAQSHPLLTVSDIDGFAEAGGMIELVLAGRRLQFDVNLAPVSRASLRISAQLLKLARLVSGRRDGG